nr:Rpn family recombination-promoting nuclease/putative transposase [Mediterraneibacter faecis]
MSRFRKKDRLIPIISLVFYYGSEPWDGPVDLYDMFQLESTKEENEILEKYLPNYKINLVDAERLEDVEKFSDDLQVILTMLRYRDSKEELTDYINENKKFFQNVDYETSQAMKAFLNMKQIPGEAEHKEEMVDMCKAIQEMYDDGVQHGRDELLKELIQRKLQKKKTPDQIAEELEESVEFIGKIIKEMQ